MSRLILPLAYKTLRTTGDVVFHPELNLAIKTNRGLWDPILFLVDSGTEMTTMAAADARDLDRPIPRRPVPGLTFRGMEVRAGLLRSRIPGMDATEYLFPCYFLGKPDTPVAAKNLLGLSGVINQIRLTFDGTPAPNATHGVLIVEKI